jgi:hypothetical protein
MGQAGGQGQIWKQADCSLSVRETPAVPLVRRRSESTGSLAARLWVTWTLANTSLADAAIYRCRSEPLRF